MRGQRGAVFNHLKMHEEITNMEAYDLYGCTRLSAIIYDLRKMGYVIDTVDVRARNRYGDLVTYGKYVMMNDGRMTE